MKKHSKRRGLHPRRHSDVASGEFFAWIVKVGGWDSGGRAVPPIHVGELLREEFMKPLRVTPEMLAKAIARHADFPEVDIAEAIRDVILADDDCLLDIDLSLALDRYFAMSLGFFWRSQAEQEIREWLVRERDRLTRITPLDLR